MSRVAVETRVVLQHWWDADHRNAIAVKRRSMRVSLKNYLFNVPLIEGARGDPSEHVPAAAQLAGAYCALVRAQHARVHDEGITWTGALFAPLFAELWNTAFGIQAEALAKTSSTMALGSTAAEEQRIQWISELASSLPQPEPEDWFAKETIATANLLANAYVKACAELKAVCATPSEPAVVLRHHASIVAEILADMPTLALESETPSDLRLPRGHAHETAARAQERARAVDGSI